MTSEQAEHRERAERARGLIRIENLSDRDRLVALVDLVVGLSSINEVRQAMTGVSFPVYEYDITRAISHEAKPLFPCGTCEEQARKAAENLVPHPVGNAEGLS